MSLMRRLSWLTVACALFAVSLTVSALADNVTLNESVNQGNFQGLGAMTPGTLLLCDEGSTGQLVNGSWGCFTGQAVGQVAPSDSIRFNLNGSGRFCSDPGDGGDFCTPAMTGDFAINEVLSLENGIENTPYMVVGGDGKPGSPAVVGAMRTYNLISDTPEPSSLLLLGSGVMGLLGLARRRFL